MRQTNACYRGWWMQGWKGAPALYGLVRESLWDRIWIQIQRNRVGQPRKYLGRKFPSRVKSKCKCPEVEARSGCGLHRQQRTSAWDLLRMRKGGVGGQVEGLAGLGKGLDLCSKWDGKGLKGSKQGSYRGLKELLCWEWSMDGIKTTMWKSAAVIKVRSVRSFPVR